MAFDLMQFVLTIVIGFGMIILLILAYEWLRQLHSYHFKEPQHNMETPSDAPDPHFYFWSITIPIIIGILYGLGRLALEIFNAVV